MAKLTQVVNVLSTWGYISVVRIKTKPDPALKIVVKRTPEFQKNFDEFAKQLQERREERDRLRAEEQEAKSASKDESTTDKAADGEAEKPAEEESKDEAKDEPEAEAKDEPEAAAQEQTKA